MKAMTVPRRRVLLLTLAIPAGQALTRVAAAVLEAGHDVLSQGIRWQRADGRRRRLGEEGVTPIAEQLAHETGVRSREDVRRRAAVGLEL